MDIICSVERKLKKTPIENHPDLYYYELPSEY